MKEKKMFSIALATLILVLCLHFDCKSTQAYPVWQGTLVARALPSTENVEKPVTSEKSPPGDIPDNQVFIPYRSAVGGYSLEVPEGWARSEKGADVMLTDHLDGIAVAVTEAPKPPSAAGVRADQAKSLEQTGKAVTIRAVKEVKVSKMPVVHMVYESNSETSPVTNKEVRLENEVFFFFKDGRLATLTLWAPVGADNADQWKLISRRFRWN
jgi:hypothetical protein